MLRPTGHVCSSVVIYGEKPMFPTPPGNGALSLPTPGGVPHSLEPQNPAPFFTVQEYAALCSLAPAFSRAAN